MVLFGGFQGADISPKILLKQLSAKCFEVVGLDTPGFAEFCRPEDMENVPRVLGADVLSDTYTV